MASGGAPPSLPLNNKDNLPADKVVLPSADNDDEEEDEGDIIVMTQEASGPVTPHAFKGKGKQKQAGLRCDA